MLAGKDWKDFQSCLTSNLLVRLLPAKRYSNFERASLKAVGILNYGYFRTVSLRAKLFKNLSGSDCGYYNKVGFYESFKHTFSIFSL
jgi:hypothetical protein